MAKVENTQERVHDLYSRFHRPDYIDIKDGVATLTYSSPIERCREYAFDTKTTQYAALNDFLSVKDERSARLFLSLYGPLLWRVYRGQKAVTRTQDIADMLRAAESVRLCSELLKILQNQDNDYSRLWDYIFVYSDDYDGNPVQIRDSRAGMKRFFRRGEGCDLTGFYIGFAPKVVSEPFHYVYLSSERNELVECDWDFGRRRERRNDEFKQLYWWDRDPEEKFAYRNPEQVEAEEPAEPLLDTDTMSQLRLFDRIRATADETETDIFVASRLSSNDGWGGVWLDEPESWGDAVPIAAGVLEFLLNQNCRDVDDVVEQYRYHRRAHDGERGFAMYRCVPNVWCAIHVALRSLAIKDDNRRLCPNPVCENPIYELTRNNKGNCGRTAGCKKYVYRANKKD